MEEGIRPLAQPVKQILRNNKYNFRDVFNRHIFSERSPEWRTKYSAKNNRVQMNGRG